MKNENEDLIEEVDAIKIDELALLNDKYLRLAAEYENYRRRTSQTIADSRDNGIIDMFLKLTTFIENMRAANENGQYTLLYKSLLKGLNEAGFTPYGEVGDEFGDEYEAIGTMHTGDVPDGCVNSVYSLGWKYKNGKIVQYCKVMVEKS